MFTTRSSKRFLLATVIGIGCLGGSVARAEDSMEFTTWTNFKVGSSETLAGDMDMPNGKVHIETTRTLVSIADDEVVVENKSVVTVMGQTHEAPAKNETIKKTRDETETVKETGEQDVEAMGKTFKCKVYEVTKEKDKNAPANPHAMAGDQKATVYGSKDVPGGVVKMEVTGPNGKTLNFVLKAMESK